MIALIACIGTNANGVSTETPESIAPKSGLSLNKSEKVVLKEAVKDCARLQAAKLSKSELAEKLATSGIDSESGTLISEKAAEATPSALYSRPDGYFFWGMTEDYGSITKACMLGPAFTPAKWRNLSNADSERFSWSFIDPDYVSETPPAIQTITDTDLEAAYPIAIFEAPTLTAFAGAESSSTYTWSNASGAGYVQTGGSTRLSDGSVVGTCNYDLGLKFASGTAAENVYIFGTGSEQFWKTTKVEAIANYFKKPLHAYFFTKVWIHCGHFEADNDAEFALTIQRVVDGVLSDTIAASVCLGGDVVADDRGYCAIPFTFTAKDPDTGLETETHLEIKDAIFITLSGFTDGKVKSLDPFFQSGDHPSKESNAFIYLKNTSSGKMTLANTSSVLKDFYTSFLFNMDAVYPYLWTKNTQYDAPNTGGTQNFDITSYWIPEVWKIEHPDWISTGECTTNKETGINTLPVTAAPLPAGMEGRTAYVKITSYACDLTLKVVQGNGGTSGIDANETEAGVKAVRQGDDFMLSYPQGLTAVTVYAVSGVRIASYPLSANGQFTLPAAELPKGVYILEFSGNQRKSIKILK